MDIRQKIGQMFMARGLRVYEDETWEMIRKGWIGNVHVRSQMADSTEALREAQAMAPHLLFIGADMEQGLCFPQFRGTRLGNLWQLGVIDDAELVYRFGTIIAREARAAGINFNFGPVVDWACDPANPLTCTRSFGPDREKLIRLAIPLVRAFQDNGVMASAKHYPCGGRKDRDTHIDNCAVTCSEAELFATDLDIYRQLIAKADLSAVMSGHTSVTAIDGDIPATLSRRHVQNLLDLGFQGVLITDSLSMKGLSGEGTMRDVFRRALAAGNDIILGDYRRGPAEQFEYLYSAYVDGLISEAEIDEHVAKILRWKEKCAAIVPPAPDFEEAARVAEEIARRSIAVDPVVSIRPGETLFIVTRDRGRDEQIGAEVSFGEAAPLAPILEEVFPEAEVMVISEEPLPGEIERTLDKAESYKEIVFCGSALCGSYKGTADFSKRLLALIGGLRRRIRVFVTIGNPFAARELPPEIPFKVSCPGNAESDLRALAAILRARVR